MMDPTKNVLSDIKEDVYTQAYAGSVKIDGVSIMEVRKFSGEDGVFEEILRVNEKGFLEKFPTFKISQVNYSRLLPGAIKAWHLHFNQEDIWYVSYTDNLLLGLWDVREHSKTKDAKMRVVMGAGSSKLVYIPRGVAHGVANISSKEASIIYFVNQTFNISSPDEKRLPWDHAGVDFWKAEKG